MSLTVIIPFLNEGIEIENTLKSIRKTSTSVKVLLINDYSDDGFDYERVALKYDAKIVKNDFRCGVALSRDIGVSLIDTHYFLIIDGHMRFLTDDWEGKLMNRLKENKNSLLCCSCRGMNYKEEIKLKYFGAKINFNGDSYLDILEGKWITDMGLGESNSVEIPCLMGASYASEKKYWEYLGGLNGLRSWGSDEILISIKCWLSGGRILLQKDIEIGHLFREGKPPYMIYRADTVFNKVLIAKIYFENELQYNILESLKNIDILNFKIALKLLDEDYATIVNELSCHFDKIKCRSMDEYVLFNEKFKSMYNKYI